VLNANCHSVYVDPTSIHSEYLMLYHRISYVYYTMQSVRSLQALRIQSVGSFGAALRPRRVHAMVVAQEVLTYFV
jgi:hypothetical protein